MYKWNKFNLKSYQAQSHIIRVIMMDMESYLIVIDKHVSCYMSNNIQDFLEPIICKRVKIKWFQDS